MRLRFKANAVEKGLEGKARFANIAAAAKLVSLFGFAKLALDLPFLSILRSLTQVSQTPCCRRWVFFRWMADGALPEPKYPTANPAEGGTGNCKTGCTAGRQPAVVRRASVAPGGCAGAWRREATLPATLPRSAADRAARATRSHRLPHMA